MSKFGLPPVQPFDTSLPPKPIEGKTVNSSTTPAGENSTSVLKYYKENDFCPHCKIQGLTSSYHIENCRDNPDNYL